MSIFQVDNRQELKEGEWFVSSSNFVNFSIGDIVNPDDNLDLKGKLPGRLIPLFDLPTNLFNENKKEVESKNETKNLNNNLEKDDDFLLKKEIEEREALQDLYGKQNYNNKFPHIKGQGEIEEKFVVIKMLSRYFELPFRKDTILKILEHHEISGNFKNFGLIEFSAILDMQGLNTTNLNIGIQNLQRVPTPSLLGLEKKIYIIWNVDKDGILISDPLNSQIKLSFRDFKLLVKDKPLQLLAVQRTKNTPKKRFGLSWFLPYVIQHKRILIQVFLLVSLFSCFNYLIHY